jgi:hypothetical protein
VQDVFTLQDLKIFGGHDHIDHAFFRTHRTVAGHCPGLSDARSKADSTAVTATLLPGVTHMRPPARSAPHPSFDK